MIEPGSTIGILGGGQLGRMTAMAAARLGYRSIILAPDADCIAAEVADRWIEAPYTDESALQELASACDVVTIEFENVPASSLTYLAQLVPTAPAANVLAVTQDRYAEKKFVTDLGIGVAPFRTVNDQDELKQALTEYRGGILKTRLFGYDGKGQVRLAADADPGRALDEIGHVPAILEGLITFACEVSVITARSWSGNLASFAPVENRHKDGILDQTLAPADLPAQTMNEAVRIAERIAIELDLVGLVAVEMFMLADGQLLVNEMAPRPHNSGHWTIDAAAVSQFEQYVRAICDLPLGDPTVCRPARMRNLIGDDAGEWPLLLNDPYARLHLYGKKAPRPGRKMGHVTWVD